MPYDMTSVQRMSKKAVVHMSDNHNRIFAKKVWHLENEQDMKLSQEWRCIELFRKLALNLHQYC